MKVIYKLPQFLAVVVLIGIVITTYPYIPLSNATDVLEIAKYQSMVDTSLIGVTGIDLYTIFNNIVILFILALAIVRCNVIHVQKWVGLVIGALFTLVMIYGTGAIVSLDSIFAENGMSVITMKGQYIYGTVPMIIILSLVLAKVLKKNTWQMLDYVAPLWLIKIIFTRVACFSAGCCGVESCTIFGIDIVLPAQLFEVLVALVMLQIAFNLEQRKLEDNDKPKKQGYAYCIAVLGPAVFRFLADFMRDIPISVLGMTSAQIYSLVCIVIAILVLIRLKNKPDLMCEQCIPEKESTV